MSECGVGEAAEQASILRTALPGEKIQDRAKWGPGVSPRRLCQGECCISTMRQVVVISPDRSGEAIAVLDCLALWDRAGVPNPSPLPLTASRLGPQVSEVTDHTTIDSGHRAPTGPAVATGGRQAPCLPLSLAQPGHLRQDLSSPRPWAEPRRCAHRPQPGKSTRGNPACFCLLPHHPSLACLPSGGC